MKNVLLLSFFLVFLLNYSSAFSEGNIAIVDLDRAMLMSNYAVKQDKVLQADNGYKNLVEKIKEIQVTLQSLQKEAETKALTWSDEQKQLHQKKAQKIYAELNNLASQEVAVRKRLDANIKKELAPKVEVIVNKIIEEKKIGLLLKAKAVYFRAPEFDITEELVKRLNGSE
ncbi:MAG: outer membrane protein [Granulosicoccus sp.]|jgi:outer membrane protein